MTFIDTRRDQMFPVLDAAQIATAKRFASGAARNFAPGEVVYDVGERHAPTWLVLAGATKRRQMEAPTCLEPHCLFFVSTLSG